MQGKLKRCSTFSRENAARNLLPFPLSPKPTKAEMKLSTTCVRREPVSPELVQEAAGDVCIDATRLSLSRGAVCCALTMRLRSENAIGLCGRMALTMEAVLGQISTSPLNLTLQLFRVSQFLLYEDCAASWCGDYSKFLLLIGWKHHFCRRQQFRCFKVLSQKKKRMPQTIPHSSIYTFSTPMGDLVVVRFPISCC